VGWLVFFPAHFFPLHLLLVKIKLGSEEITDTPFHSCLYFNFGFAVNGAR